MSNFFFTSDCHFNHAKIILYSNRKPFYREGVDNLKDTHTWVSDEVAKDCCNKMDNGIIDNWNSVVSKDDTVYHLGDFCFTGNNVARDYEKRLNGRVVHINGNHDKNNGVKGLIESCIMEFGNLSVFAQHHPPSRIEEIPEWCDLILCGHVHEKWKYKLINGIVVINVGVDQWNYTPVKIETLLKARKDVLRGKYGKFEFI